MALSQAYVERIFARMLVRYGAAWLRMWEGIPMEAVQADWAEELGGFERNPRAIKHGLDHLPQAKPPTVIEFRQLCSRVPEYAQTRLPPPKKDPEKARATREAFRAALRAKTEPVQGKAAFAWAYELQEREKSGEVLTEAQRGMWRAALAEAPVIFLMGEFRAPSADALPPGMRPNSMELS